MLTTLWNTIFYRPLYNLLLLCVAFMPNADVGLAVIVLTILVKLVLFPFTQKSIESQMKMKALEPEINKIKETVTDKAEATKQTFALYKERKISPFSSCLPTLIQLPIIIGLYLVFLHGFGSVSVLPYSFAHVPETFNLKFLGFFDLANKSIVLAVLAGITQYIQGYLMQKRTGKAATGEGMAGQFASTLQTQMLYVLPVMIAFIAYRVGGAVALYWITSNMVTIGQELYTRRKLRNGKIL
jgi:YidC/Oxa1 family membrane protein insertase